MPGNVGNFDNSSNNKIEVEARDCTNDTNTQETLPSFGNVKSSATYFKLRRFMWIFAVIIVLCLAFFITIFFIGQLNQNSGLKNLFKNPDIVETQVVNNSENAGEKNVSLVPSATQAKGEFSATEIYNKVSPAIVGVITSNKEFGLGRSMGQGTGIVFSKDGYILTNAHVIGNSKNNNIIVVVNEKEYEARVIGFDSSKDVAVLKIEASNLTCAEFGDSDKVCVGEEVFALGNPGGMELSKTLTKGIVSAVGRSLNKDVKDLNFIQFDAAVNHGNSGGALINKNAQVIGISSMKIIDITQAYEGLGFAIPINIARNVANKIIKDGHTTGNVKLGITAQTISKWDSQAYDVPPGVLIRKIYEGSSFKNTNIRAGDIILKFNGAKVLNTESLKEKLKVHKPGDVVEIVVFRQIRSWKQEPDSETFTVKVTLLEDK